MTADKYDPRFRDPRWFPVDLGVRRRDYMCLSLEDRVLDTSVFIDNRIEAPLDAAERVNADRIDSSALPQGPVGWIWHTSFCGSSLLARCLHVPPAQVSLKEPLILRRLGDAREKGFDLGDGPMLSARLLARPLHEGGAVVIKPTHAALNVAVDLMQALPDSRAIVLYSSLEDFMVSNLKKSPVDQGRVPLLVNRALNATGLRERLLGEAAHPPGLLGTVALQWGAQRELVADVLHSIGSSRIRSLEASELYGNPAFTAERVQQWLGLPASSDRIAARCSKVALTHAKAFDQPYDAQVRIREAAVLRARHQSSLDDALAWADRVLLPAMRPDALELVSRLPLA